MYRRGSRYRKQPRMRSTPTLLRNAILARFAGALIALGVASSAVAQDVPRDRPIDDARVASVRDRLTAAATRAEDEGLPRAWIEAKVREGLAKHVPPARIAAAVEQLAGRMREAATIARTVPVAGRTEVARAVLDALAIGARSEALGQLVREVAQRNGSAASDAQRALAAIAELGERGFEPALATQSALTAWHRGGRDALRTLVAVARNIPRAEARARGAELTRAAESSPGRSEPRGRSEADGRGRPSDRGGPPHDDSFTQGASRGRGRALGRVDD